MATPAATTTAAAPAAVAPVWATDTAKWSSTANFATADVKLATAWATNAKLFTCTQKSDTMAATDCNALLGETTGACCYGVAGNKNPATISAANKKILTELAKGFPVSDTKAKGVAKMFFCATDKALAAQNGWTAGTNAAMPMNVGGVSNLSQRWLKMSATSKTKRTALIGATATWTCSGAQTLAATGVAAVALISLM